MTLKNRNDLVSHSLKQFRLAVLEINPGFAFCLQKAEVRVETKLLQSQQSARSLHLSENIANFSANS